MMYGDLKRLWIIILLYEQVDFEILKTQTCFPIKDYLLMPRFVDDNKGCFSLSLD